MTPTNVIDHSLLIADCTSDGIKHLCAQAIEYGLVSVTVPPYYVKEASRLLSDTPTKVATVIGYPMGFSTIPAKVEEIKRAINDGVDELDVVVNLCAVMDNNWNYVKNDIDSTTRISHLRGKIIKIILDTSLLSAKQTQQLCTICNECEVDFVKTSVGSTTQLINTDTVQLLKNNLVSKIKIMATGKISSIDEIAQLIKAGANRIGGLVDLDVLQKQSA